METPATLALNLEEVKALFFDPSALVMPAYQVYRANDNNEARWYYRPDTDRYYVSVTTFIQATTPTPYGLTEWMKTNGKNADRMRDEAAGYGTFMHTVFSDYLIMKEYDLDLLVQNARDAAQANGVLGKSIMERGTYEKRIVRDLIGWAEFCYVHSVEPLGIELILTSEKDGTGGAMDLLCKMRIGSGANGKFLKKDGLGTQVVAIIDWKSGSSFYESHELQIHQYHRMQQENFPAIKVDKLYNYKPSDWTKNAGWTLKDQTESKHACKIERLLSLFFEDNSAPTPTLEATGILKLGESTEGKFSFEDIRSQIAKQNEAV